MTLAELDQDMLGPGQILRFPASYPYETLVNFMAYQHPGAGCGLIVTTGHKAGFVAVLLPDEAQVSGKIGLNAAWLARN